MDGWLNGWMEWNGWINEWMDGATDRRMDRMDGWTDRQTDG